jgi:hypothetical protein
MRGLQAAPGLRAGRGRRRTRSKPLGPPSLGIPNGRRRTGGQNPLGLPFPSPVPRICARLLGLDDGAYVAHRQAAAGLAQRGAELALDRVELAHLDLGVGVGVGGWVASQAAVVVWGAQRPWVQHGKRMRRRGRGAEGTCPLDQQGRTCTRICKHASKGARTHAHTRTRARTHAHTHLHTHTHNHAHPTLSSSSMCDITSPILSTVSRSGRRVGNLGSSHLNLVR